MIQRLISSWNINLSQGDTLLFSIRILDRSISMISVVRMALILIRREFRKDNTSHSNQEIALNSASLLACSYFMARRQSNKSKRRERRRKQGGGS